MYNMDIMYFDIVAYITLLCLFIVLLVASVLLYVGTYSKGFIVVKTDYQVIEFLWTFIPSLWVGGLCFFNVSYICNDYEGAVGTTYKIVGRQWYWTYNYIFNGEEVEYDSYMTNLVNNVDNPLCVIYNNVSRLLVTSSDVIHSFSVPDLGLKIDAIPGRINQIVYNPSRMGSFVGYCSELCGAGHSYMPIIVEVIANKNSVVATVAKNF
uniref:cytochrome-c oxidase n=1 Tax=Thaparocleidus varicus TaxID=341076 RepID=A0A7L8ZR54_9PLAT|nr:cytochrome c oxidase subunit II [Thaparocleidus varicus]QOI72757.1 cytochrome c oxidase subunit 2 [Thaparocleidus varicus]